MLRFRDDFCVAVVMAVRGYLEQPELGSAIDGLEGPPLASPVL